MENGARVGLTYSIKLLNTVECVFGSIFAAEIKHQTELERESKQNLVGEECARALTRCDRNACVRRGGWGGE